MVKSGMDSFNYFLNLIRAVASISSEYVKVGMLKL